MGAPRDSIHLSNRNAGLLVRFARHMRLSIPVFRIVLVHDETFYELAQLLPSFLHTFPEFF